MTKTKTKPSPPPAWGRVPLVPAVVGFGLGIFVADAMGYTGPAAWWYVAMACFLPVILSVLFPGPERWKAVGASAFILLLFFTLGGWRNNATYLPEQADFFASQLEAEDLLAVTINSLRPGRKSIRAETTVKALLNDSTGNRSVTGQLLLYLPPDEKTSTLSVGDEIVFKGEIRELKKPLNPHVFDLRAYWHRQAIYHQVFLREGADWRVSQSARGGLRARAERWRNAWFQTFQAYLSGDELAVAAALVMGKRDGISQEVKSAYTETGAIHVLAVSGLHVGIIFLILRFLLVTVLRLDRTTAGRWLVAGLSVVAVWLFALVSGFSPSVQRSAIMFTILAIGGISHRKGDIFNTLAAAALLMLWLDPGQLFRVGFQLSFTAIIGIVLFASPIDRLIRWPTKLLRAAWSTIAASTGAQLGTLPLSLYNFGQFPTYFLVSGTVVIVSAFGAMFLGLFHGLVVALGGESAVASLTGALLGAVIGLQNAFIFFFQQLPGSLIKVPELSWYWALLLAIGIGLLAIWVRWRNWWTLLAGIVVFVGTFFGARAQVPGEVKGATLTLYHVSRGGLMDIRLGGETAFALGSEPAPDDLAWTAGPNREHYGYEPAFTLPFTADTIVGDLALSNGILTVGDTRWLILDKNLPTEGVPNGDFTHLLVRNGYRPDRLPEVSGTPLLVVDGSNPTYRLAEWRGLGERLNWEIHATGEDGALILEW
ncbi:ComEC/Rec2 family competence protein [Neolewinella agarilytica]|uniref:ComEC/Rec2 family competence protein n=1 Tax=Neolewinella agarilytica TaxID=478744 RepID=UPI0023573D0D|nr:ComEC/Rec2 family competence protein [Neolewinella agarilytica]